MVRAPKAVYSFTTKEAALANLEFRIYSSYAMLRMEGIAAPRIQFGYASTPADRKADTTYWEKVVTATGADKNWMIKTKAGVDRYNAFAIGIRGGVTEMECLSGLQASYYIGATNILTKVQFNQRFPDPITIQELAGFPFLEFGSDPAVDQVGKLGNDFDLLVLAYRADIFAGKAVGSDGKYFARMKEIRGEIRDYFDKRKVEPITGDMVYFINSRFYSPVYSEDNSLPGQPKEANGFWQGENTIAYIQQDGKRYFTGLGLGALKTEDQLNAKLKENLYASNVLITRYLNSLAARPEVIAAAAKCNLTVAAYAQYLYDQAALIDIGMFLMAKAKL